MKKKIFLLVIFILVLFGGFKTFKYLKNKNNKEVKNVEKKKTKKVVQKNNNDTDINDSDNTLKTSKGFDIVNKDGITYIDDILIVNKTYSLPENYGNGLEKEVTDAFKVMKADAAALNLNIYISSGFRSYQTQVGLYQRYVNKDGKEAADKYSARPGYSEHQSGLSFDLNSINDSFTNTEEGKWVNSHCYLYGFVIRFPKDKESLTGYKYESWHLRYVGKDLAKKLYNNGDWLSLEEYFGIESVYKD